MLLEHNIPVYNKLEEMMKTNGKALVVTTTGTGKSYLGLEYAEKHNLKTLVVVPKVVIGNAWEALSPKFESITYHSFVKLRTKPAVDLIIFDEAHHCGSRDWEAKIRKFLDTYDIPYIGLTADSVRWTDGARDVKDIFWEDSLVEGYTLKDAIQDGILPTIKYISAFYNLGSFKDRYSSRSLSAPLLAKFNYAVNNCKKVSDILKENMPANKRKGIIFVDAISQIGKAEELIKEVYPDLPTYFVHSHLSQKINENRIEEFDKLEEGFMISVDMFNEGLHLHGVNTVIMLRRTTSPNIFFQQIGRAMSVGSFDRDTIIFDFVGNNLQLRSTASFIRKRKAVIDSLTEIFSDQILITDYTKDIIDVINEIDYILAGGWTEEEDDIIRKYYTNEGTKIIKRLENRTASAVKVRAQKLGVPFDMNEWTEEEDNILKQYYPIEGDKVYKRLNGRTPNACRARALVYNLKHVAERMWKDYEDEIIKEQYPIVGVNGVIKLLPHRSKSGISNRAKKLGVYDLKPKEKRKWTEEEDNILKQYYPIEGLKVCKRFPNRKESAIMARIQDLGIYKLGPDIKRVRWTKEEEDIIRKYYPTEGSSVANRLPGRDRTQTRNKAALMGINCQVHKGGQNHEN